MPPRHQMMAPHWPTLACPLPAVDQVGGCDFVKAVPEDARAKIHEIVTGFKSVERFRSYKGKNPLLDGHTPNEQHRLKVRLTALYMTLERLRPKHSAIVELGTYVGTTAMGMRMVMDHLGYRYPRHILHVYDSWQGLPAPRDYEGDRSELKKGGLRSSVTDYLDRFRAAGLDPPYIHKGFFGEIPDSEFPEDIAFAFFDGDFYDSIHQSFNKSWRKMQPGGTVVVDDYLYPTLEGVRRCVDDFLADKPASRLPSPLNVSNYLACTGGVCHGRRAILSSILFQDYEGVITVGARQT